MVKGVGRSKGDMRLLISYGNYLIKHGLLRSKRAQVLVQHLQSLKPLWFSTGTQKVSFWLSMGDVEKGDMWLLIFYSNYLFKHCLLSARRALLLF